MQKILIVEDDGDIAAIERDYLELNNYQVEIAADGLAGLERGLHGDFDLILLDLMLPGMDGFSVCRRLREETDIPILIVTARREDIDKIRGLGLGADDYIEKPFSPSVLVARVRAHLARYQRLTGGQQRAKPELQVGGVRLNTETRRVFVDGREVELKNREYELLCFLMLHLDMVFSREELYERIWGLEAMGTTPPWRSISIGFGKRSSRTPAAPGIFRRCGARATGLKDNDREEGKWKCGSFLQPAPHFLRA